MNVGRRRFVITDEMKAEQAERSAELQRMLEQREADLESQLQAESLAKPVAPIARTIETQLAERIRAALGDDLDELLPALLRVDGRQLVRELRNLA